MIQDAHVRPELFKWNGRMTAETLNAWLREHGWQAAVPSDLFELWKETGGGDVFETETILGPMGDAALGDDIVAANRELHSRGMPEQFLAYYVGVNIGAVDVSQMEYVELDGTDFRSIRRFVSFDDWYSMTLRSEYQVRYGLP